MLTLTEAVVCGGGVTYITQSTGSIVTLLPFSAHIFSVALAEMSLP